MEDLEKNPVRLSDIKQKRIETATAEIESILLTNYNKRENGAFLPRVNDDKLKSIASEYNLTLKEIVTHLDQKLVKCINNYEKYI